jgi:hypothetical protein
MAAVALILPAVRPLPDNLGHLGMSRMQAMTRGSQEPHSRDRALADPDRAFYPDRGVGGEDPLRGHFLERVGHVGDQAGGPVGIELT